MEMKKLFFAAMAMAVLAGCSNEEEMMSAGNQDITVSEGEGYLSLALDMPKGKTRAKGDAGTTEEQTITSAMAVLFKGGDESTNPVIVDVKDLAWADGTPSANVASDAFAVSKDASHILVVVNPMDALRHILMKGNNLSAVKAAIQLTDEQIESMSKAGNFLMNNVSLIDCSGSIKKFSNTEGEKKLSTTDDLKNAAKGDPISVPVDRAVAKVTLIARPKNPENPNPMDQNSFVNSNSIITLEGWRVNVTNKKFILLPDTVHLKNAGLVYNKDANYDNNRSFANQNYFDEFKVDNSFQSLDNNVLYCTENTMQATDQVYAYTTQVVLKAKYARTKAGITENNSWFRYSGILYTFDELKSAYNATPANAELKAACDKFAEIIVSKKGDSDPTFADVAPDLLNDSTSIKVKSSGIDYYHEGICYYKVMIRHDQDNQELMSLGRYGVVRNNWYTLTVTNIRDLGLPYPGDPAPDKLNPDKKPDLDETMDDVENYVSVSIQVKDWTAWQQNVEL